jgi:hypothetical protein
MTLPTMTLRTKTIATACATLALVWAASAQPAQARWTFHDDAVGEKITAPPGGTRTEACAGRLQATAGYGHFIDVDGGEDPAAFQVPAQARDAVSYQVWKAPAGFTSFAGAIEDRTAGQVYFDPDGSGTRHRATLAGHVTTPARAVLRTPEPSGGNSHVSGTFIFAAAPISVALTGVSPGDRLGLLPVGTGSFVDVTAIDCGLPLVRGRVDLLPGSRRNPVHPTNAAELVPVRIFGSRNLNVRRITTVHLGEALAASARRPRDVNRDGRPDRLYTFRQGETDIMCIDTAVTVTGLTSDHKRFQARSSIAPAGCPD